MKARGLPFAGCLAALAIVCGLVAPTAATAAKAPLSKPYSLKMTPAAVPSGSQATISATYKNLTSQQQLGSANLMAPTGFTVTSAQITGFSFAPAPSGAGATVQSNVVKLRGLSIPPGGSVTVSMTVTTPCTASGGEWTSIVKQANDFNGQPGNDLTLDPSQSSTTTTTTGGCRLSFTTQPKDVQVGSTITGIAGNPAGPPVAVTVLDGAGVATTAAIDVTVGLGTAPSGAMLVGTKTVTSFNGVASFGTLSVTKPGTYALVATSPHATSATSDSFKAHDVLVPCLNNEFCTATAATSGTVSKTPYTNTFKVDAPPNPDGVVNDSGMLAVSYNSGPSPSCSTYAPVSPDHEVILGPNRLKTVTSTIAKPLLDARRRSASSLRTCLVAPYQFSVGLASANGGKAQPIPDVDGDGLEDYVGILPQCQGSNVAMADPPCQVSAGTDAQGNGIVVYLLRADPRDPAARH
ncbi:MAG: hypothetical protein AVDCRST_MAG67-2904 [uncultured Solirubrobacteraceae bacterium]|uniref:Uncharacterized protein n=1 Tax=uncultured Solirubrobacteraceae bacterium TaxID=1162706 RepID=A0A6J4T4I7_9ACTN|nr:MAG: hypothetical protein AVDCRST_MAG67-2904 [uncultured Solirubrobacteraceae bacterium]